MTTRRWPRRPRSADDSAVLGERGIARGSKRRAASASISRGVPLAGSWPSARRANARLTLRRASSSVSSGNAPSRLPSFAPPGERTSTGARTRGSAGRAPRRSARDAATEKRPPRPTSSRSARAFGESRPRLPGRRAARRDPPSARASARRSHGRTATSPARRRGCQGAGVSWARARIARSRRSRGEVNPRIALRLTRPHAFLTIHRSSARHGARRRIVVFYIPQ
jgi:hypothetical protein